MWVHMRIFTVFLVVAAIGHTTGVVSFHKGGDATVPDLTSDMEEFEKTIGRVELNEAPEQKGTHGSPAVKKTHSIKLAPKSGATAAVPPSADGLSARHAAKNAVSALAGFEKSMAESETQGSDAEIKDEDKATPHMRQHAALKTSKKVQNIMEVSKRMHTTSTDEPEGTMEMHHAERSAARASKHAVDDLTHFEKAVSKTQSHPSNTRGGLKSVGPVRTASSQTDVTEVKYGKEELMLAKGLVEWLQRDHTGAKCDSEFERQQCGHLSCSTNKTCQFCRDDDDCHSPRYRCFGPKKSACLGDTKMCECHHKNLFPMVGADYEAMVLTFLATAVAASGGIGGGGLLVPLFILLEDFEADLASPLSSATITGGAIVGYMLHCRRWHPFFPAVQRPLIDYDSVLIILPSLLTGTMIGTILDKILPIWFIITMLFLLLGISTVRTCQKGIQALEAEGGDSAAPLQSEHEKTEGDEDQDEEVALEIQGTRFPKQTLALIVLFWFFVFFVALLKGGSSGASILPFVECNNGAYWGIQVFCWVVMFVIFIFVRYQVLNYGAGGLDGDVVWTPRNSITIPLVCLPCGICAGLLGVGGGMVVAPLLVELGARHEVIMATSTFTVLITASSSATQFVLMGKLPVFYAFFFAVIGGVGTCFGQIAVEGLIKRLRSTSVIVFGISVVIFTSTCAIGYTGIRALVRIAEIGGNVGLRNLCD